ncbi:MAG TPA: hopanoid-associated phosphorylase [Stellaceae bacterium]|nr:hopanoid-associated phosphorylase [Stellaceae bacterium]
MSVGAVCGLRAEAIIARQIGLVAAAGGGSSAGTHAAIARLLAAGVRALVSFGIAGALAPSLGCGALLLPAAVRSSDGAAYWVDREWHARLAAAAQAKGIPVTVGGMLGHDAIVPTAAEKATLYRATNALAVDMESAHVAEAAARARLPFVILRAVADPATQDLPPAASVPLRANGRADIAAVLASLAREPQQIPALLGLAGATATALWTLYRTGRALGPALRAP